MVDGVPRLVRFTKFLERLLRAEDLLERARRVDMSPDRLGMHSARLRTPNGEFFLESVTVWGGSAALRQTVDLIRSQVPCHLHESGLAECELVVLDDTGAELFAGPLQDDGNRMDQLGRIVVVVLEPGHPDRD
jgi:hypothetical protein